MIKVLLTLIMVFTFGTSTVNAEENTTSIEDRISELAETKSDSQSIIKSKVNELSEDELKTVISNINELTEPTEDELVIKEATISKLEEMKIVEALNPLNILKLNPLTIGMGFLVLGLMHSEWLMELTGYSDESKYPLIVGMGVLLIMIVNIFTKWWFSGNRIQVERV